MLTFNSWFFIRRREYYVILYKANWKLLGVERVSENSGRFTHDEPFLKLISWSCHTSCITAAALHMTPADSANAGKAWRRLASLHVEHLGLITAMVYPVHAVTSQPRCAAAVVHAQRHRIIVLPDEYRVSPEILRRQPARPAARVVPENEYVDAVAPPCLWYRWPSPQTTRFLELVEEARIMSCSGANATAGWNTLRLALSNSGSKDAGDDRVVMMWTRCMKFCSPSVS